MTLEEARKLYEKAMKEEILSKYSFPTKPSSDGYFHIYVKDETKKSGRRQLKDKDLDKLREKVYSYEHKCLSFKECFSRWQESRLKYIKDPEKLISVNNTLSRDRSEYKRYFEGSALEEKDISEITEKEISDYTFYILNKINLKQKALNSYKSILNGIFKYAYTNNLIILNPMDRVDFAKYKYMLMRPTPIEDRVHPDDILDKMLEYTLKYEESHPDFIPAYAFELQILTGFRRGELPPLRWEDVFEDYILVHREQLTIHGRKEDNYEIVGHTKNYKNRKFPITNNINIFLNKLKKINKIYYNSEFLFPLKTNPTKPIGNNAVYKFYYYKVCKDLGIETGRDIIKGTHSFRRNGISKVINMGHSFEIAAILYGNSPRTAEKYYFAGLSMHTAKNIFDGNQQ